MARSPVSNGDTSTTAAPKRKPQRAADRKLYILLQPGVDAAQFKSQIASVTFNGKLVLEAMSAGEVKPFVILKLDAASRGGSEGGEETVTVE
jgi:hypothetical protein